jgi:sporulation protein YlmC with PRC-barrel domain
MTGPHGYPPKEYAVLSVPLGKLRSVSENSLLYSSVKNAEGKIIGSVTSLLMDSHTGQIESAVVLLDDSKRLEAVPWAHMKKWPNQEKQEFILDTTHFQLSPSPGASKDRSLEVERLIADMRANLRAESRNPERTIVKIEIIMQDRGCRVKGHSLPDSLTAIVLRNHDTETHGFSSPLFKDVVIRKEGDAIEVKENGVWSYHVPPGKTATLYFTQASRVDPLTGMREITQYPFQCDIYPNMKGEFLVIETRGEMGGG